MKNLKSKTILITGGTGSFGNEVLNYLLKFDPKEIRIFSRDEKKQDDMRKKFNNSKINFYLGDVRDYKSILDAVSGSDYIFHAAALKQVPSCEFYPMEAVKTNILGTENVIDAASTYGVKKIICLSTDKAVYPINSMGVSKSMMEKVAVAKSRTFRKTGPIICITRYGNVMASRGSVIPLFINQVKKGNPITITDPKMTRFMMSLQEAVKLVLFAFEKGKNGDILVQKSPAVTMEILAKSILEILKKDKHPIKIIGTRHGEKIYETLLSREEKAVAKDLGNYFRIASDSRDLNYDKYFKSGEIKITKSLDYNSNNTKQLNIKQIKKMLINLKDTENSFL